MIDESILEAFRDGNVTVLTGAGISTESGIPTFRGEEGYWTVGSEVYTPEDFATFSNFTRMPKEVWQWYLYRRNVCRGAKPNAGHIALVTLQEVLGKRMTLVSQNVDGLHRRAGHASLMEIHGNIDFMRPVSAQSGTPVPIPAGFETIDRSTPIDDTQWRALSDKHGNAYYRPHVLWFDETYNEEWFCFDSALHATAETDILVTVGTSGATNLPSLMVRFAVDRGAMVLDVNPDRGPFAHAAKESGGQWLQGCASDILPELLAQVRASSSCAVD